MIQKQREQDDAEDKQQERQQGDNQQSGQGGNSGIHKYFNKANKQLKFFNPKIKKSFKSGILQNFSITSQCNLKKPNQFKNYHEKAKLKLQYRFWSNYFKTTPKIKINLNSFFNKKLFEEASLSWKKITSKIQDQNYELKFNQKMSLMAKYKRTKFYMEKRLRHRLQTQINLENALKFEPKIGLSFQSLLKVPFYQSHKYLNSGQFKSKFSLKNLSFKNLQINKKLDFSEKLNFLIRQYKLKQQSKICFNFGNKSDHSLKSTLQITNPTNFWTLYGSVYGRKWGVDFDEIKMLWSLNGNWKLGLMYGQNKNWQISFQNQKLNKSIFTSIGVHVSNKNYAIVIKNRINKKQIGKINYQLALQSPLQNTSVDKVNFGVMVNVNL